MAYNVNYSNKVTSPKNQEGLNYRSIPSTTGKILAFAEYAKSKGRSTGNYQKMNDGVWYQVLLNNINTYAWVREDVTKFTNPTSNTITEAESKKIIDKLVSNDIEIHEILIRAANYLLSLKNAGANISSYEKKYKDLLDRHTNRQDKIKNSRVLKWQTGIKKGTEKLIQGFKNYMLVAYGVYIGEPVTITTVVIGAIIGAGLAVTAYFLFKPDYDESTTDLKISSDLEKALSTLSPEAADAVKKDLEQQVDNAYRAGKTQGTFSGMFNIIKPLAFAGFGFWIINKFINTQKGKK